MMSFTWEVQDSRLLRYIALESLVHTQPCKSVSSCLFQPEAKKLVSGEEVSQISTHLLRSDSQMGSVSFDGDSRTGRFPIQET